MKRAYTDYVCLVLRNDGLYYQFNIGEKSVEKLPTLGVSKTFTYRGNKYAFNSDYAHHLKGWVPWKEFEVFAPWSILGEIYWRFKHKVGLIIYREPKPKAISPVTQSPILGVTPEIPSKPQPSIPSPSSSSSPASVVVMPVSMHLELGYTRYSPLSFKAIILSPLYAAYRKKQRFGAMKSRWLVWLLIGALVIMAAILLVVAT